LIVYLSLSEFFLYNPSLLHTINKKKHTYSNKEYGYYLGAHRGGSLEGVENTLENHLRAK